MGISYRAERTASREYERIRRKTSASWAAAEFFLCLLIFLRQVGKMRRIKRKIAVPRKAGGISSAG